MALYETAMKLSEVKSAIVSNDTIIKSILFLLGSGVLMRQHLRKGLFSLSILCVLMYALLFSATVVFADETTPPASTEEAASSEADELPDNPDQSVEDNSQPPAEEPEVLPEPDDSSEETDSEVSGQLPADEIEETPPSSPDEQLPPAEVETVDDLPEGSSEAADEPAPVTNEEVEPPDQVPTETQIVVLVDGQVEPLATQEAANALAYGDPIWCPDDVTPGNDPSGDCTDSFGSFNTVGGVNGLLVADATNKDLHDVTGKGTIYVESGAIADTDPVVINGNKFTRLQGFELIIQGGWDFGTDTPSGTPSIFSSRLQVVNWQNNVTIKDISVSNTTSHGITVTTSGDINLQNVTSSNNKSGHGAVLSNNSAGSSGNIKVTGNSNFSDNSGSGLIANSNGNISLQNVIARDNGANGASLNNSSGTGTITLGGTNLFNGNGSNGLRAISNNNVSSDTSLTATGNGGFGAFFNTTSGTGDVTLKGTNTFSNNYLTGLNIRAGGSISLENVTASDNSQTGNPDTNRGHGAYLYNRGGVGGITLNGTNVFNHNLSNGLVAYSDGDITLSNITAGADAATGNGGYGALVNNSTGTGNVSLSGTNTFNNNTMDGLRVTSTGDITSSGSLTARDNSRYGAFLNNSAGTGNIAFTGAGTFSGNAADGLRARSSGNITSTTGLTANDNRFGVYLDNTSGTGYVDLTGTNTFNDNRRDGAYIKSNGDITVKHTTASTNRQNGFNLETTNGKSYLWCGKGDNNGAYGVQATKNQALYLFGMNFSGNALGSIYVDGGDVYYGDCSGNLFGDNCENGVRGTDRLQTLTIHSVLVSGIREQVALDCRSYAGTKLILLNGDFAFLPCPIDGFASLTSLPDEGLPGSLPSGFTRKAGFTLRLDSGDSAPGGQITISFALPQGTSAEALTILFWDGSEWLEVEGAKRKGERLEAQVDYPGIFVLVSR
jgi:hypothetical protein